MFDKGTLARMRQTQESTMMHVCLIEPYIVAGDGTVSYGKAVRSVCGFDLVSGSENNGASYETITETAKMRLPLDVKIGMNDRVTIVASFGQAVTSRMFQVTALPDSFGPSGQVVTLQEIYS